MFIALSNYLNIQTQLRKITKSTSTFESQIKTALAIAFSFISYKKRISVITIKGLIGK